MLTIKTLIGSGVLLAGTGAGTLVLAQSHGDKKPAQAEPAAAPAPAHGAAPGAPGAATAAATEAAKAGAVPAIPRPAPELTHLEWMKGSWRCEGKTPGMPGSPAHSYKSTMKFSRTLDNFWAMLEYQQKKSKEHPFPVKAQGMVNWDPGSKKYMAYGFDSFGGVSMVTATIDGAGNWSATGEQIMDGKRIPYREAITRKSDKELSVKGEWKMGAEWTTVFEDSCKK